VFFNQEGRVEAYREDLRKKIIAAREIGQSGALVARRYHVAARTVERYWKRYRETAQIAPKRQGAIASPSWRPTTARSCAGSSSSPISP
jgi:transposase